MALHRTLAAVTQHIIDHSHGPCQAYLDVTRRNAGHRVEHTLLSRTNLAHGSAAMSGEAKIRLKALERPNLGIISAYNDMLSAHQPLGAFPAWLKRAALDAGGTAQFAGGVPAMYDGVTQGQGGMELSLLSRDTVTLLTTVALSHRVFSATLCPDVCDKIVPRLVIDALSFDHLLAVFVPAGPTTTGISSGEKARTRQLYAEGKLSRADLLEAESKSYHGSGTCTFCDTTNSNQMLMEVMGLHLPGTAFINSSTPLRGALAQESARQALKLVFSGDQYTPIADVLDEHIFVNGVIGLLATGVSTSHTLHLVAMARAAGILLMWGDFSDLSSVIPLLARVYPNGKADVDGSQTAGGLSVVTRGLIDAGPLYDDVTAIMGKGPHRHAQEPFLDGEKLVWCDGTAASLNTNIVRGVVEPLSPDDGLRVLESNIGHSVIKVSAIKPEHRFVEAPTYAFLVQDDLINAFKAGEFERGFAAVLPYQGPTANGMPKLHKLTPTLSVLQKHGFKAALVTDGHMLGTSGKVPTAIHITLEALSDGPLARVRDGDIVVLGAEAGTLQVRVPEAERNVHQVTAPDLSHYHTGVRQNLFSGFRRNVSVAEEGVYTLSVSTGA